MTDKIDNQVIASSVIETAFPYITYKVAVKLTTKDGQQSEAHVRRFFHKKSAEDWCDRMVDDWYAKEWGS